MKFLGRTMSKKSDLPAVFFDEITAVTVSERMVRVTAVAGKHTLHCVLRPRDAATVHRMLGAVLGAPSGRAA